MAHETKQKVLFLCTGNQARSQMAEGILRARAGGWIDVVSAGSRPGDRVHPLAVLVLRDLGIDISAAEPKGVQRYLDEDFDYVITLCDGARDECPSFPGETERIHWNLTDPAAAPGSEEDRIEAFRMIRDDIARRIDAFLAEIGY